MAITHRGYTHGDCTKEGSHTIHLYLVLSPAGVLAVKAVKGVPTVFPADSGEVAPEEDMLQVVYDCGPVEGHSWQDFDTIRDRVSQQWASLPPNADNYSASLKAKVERLRQDMHGLAAARAQEVSAAAAVAAEAAAAAAAPAAKA
jgi:hypothetical protein